MRTSTLASLIAIQVLLLQGCGCLGSARRPIIDMGPVSSSVEWIPIAPGTALLGCESTGEDCDAANSRPQKEETIGSFLIAATETTVLQYFACVRDGYCSAVSEYPEACNASQPVLRGSYPMNCVSWSEGQRFCEWAGGRLPTEDEWEYAARGSGGRAYPWGGDAPACNKGAFLGVEYGDDVLGMCDSHSSVAVGRFPDGNTPEGVVDMAGNVEEWTLNRLPEGSGRVVYESEYYIVKGGHFDSWNRMLLSSSRYYYEDRRSTSVGFRCLREQ